VNRLIVNTLINASIIGFAFAGILFDERFLNLYQFLMWSIVIIGAVALLLPSEELYKKESNSLSKRYINGVLSVCKILVSVWVGMVVLAVFYLVISLFAYGKKQSYFDELKVKANDTNLHDDNKPS